MLRISVCEWELVPYRRRILHRLVDIRQPIVHIALITKSVVNIRRDSRSQMDKIASVLFRIPPGAYNAPQTP